MLQKPQRQLPRPPPLWTRERTKMRQGLALEMTQVKSCLSSEPYVDSWKHIWSNSQGAWVILFGSYHWDSVPSSPQFTKLLEDDHVPHARVRQTHRLFLVQSRVT